MKTTQKSMPHLHIIFRAVWYILIFSIPFEIVQVSLGGLDIRLHQVLLILVLVLGVLTYRLRIGTKIQQLSSRLGQRALYFQHFYISILLAFSLLSTLGGILYGMNFVESLIRSVVLFGYVTLFGVVYYGIRTRSQLMHVFKTMLISTGVLMGFGFYEAIAMNLDWYSFTVFDGRIDSLLPEPNWFAMWLAIMFGMILPILYYKKLKNWTLQGFLFAIILSVILSLTRAAWIAMVGITFTFFFQTWWVKRDHTRLLKMFGMLIIHLAFAVNLAPYLSGFNLMDRVVSIFSHQTTYYTFIDETDQEQKEVQKNVFEKYSFKNLTNSRSSLQVDSVSQDVNVSSRLENYRQSLEIGFRYPITGVGNAGFENREGEGLNSSNLFLGALVVAGIPGLALFLVMFYRGIIQILFLSPRELMLGSMGLGMILGIIIPSMFNDALLMAFMWLTLAVCFRIPDLIIDADLDQRDNSNQKKKISPKRG